MDKVRLGRALGYGTRHAARTLAAVAEAATAPGGSEAGRGARAAAPAEARAAAAPPAAKPVPRRAPTAGQVRKASRSFLGPLATFSSALLLRVSALFFALLGCALGAGAWRLRAVLLSAPHSAEEAQHFWVFLGFAALFMYFAVSGFVRASRRERRSSRERS